MNRIAVIRRGEWEEPRLIRALNNLNVNLTDIFLTDHLRILRVSSHPEISVRLKNHRLEDHDRIVFIGIPAKFAEPEHPTKTELFIRDEWEAAFLAALHVHCDKVVNRGEVFCHSRLLLDPSRKVRVLAGLGWRTPRVTLSYDLNTQSSDKKREPDPDSGARYFLAITPHRHFFHPFGQVRFKRSENVDELVSRTQIYMLKHGLDWGVIPLASVKGEVFAFGFSTRIPEEFSMSDVSTLLNDAVN